MKVAIIPARGGSKRIPRKNIRLFCGKPIIAWSIEAALASECFDRIIVSTDDQEIADVARAYGAEVPFMRPGHLADDYTGTVPVIKQAIEQLQSSGCQVTHVCCIYATAPFIIAEDLRRAEVLIARTGATYAFSLTSFGFPIQRAVRMDESGRVSMFQPEHLSTRSQDLEEAFHDAGQFYWGAVAGWLEEVPLFSPESIGVYLPRHRVQDIDTPEDWIRAEQMFSSAKFSEALG